MRSGCCASQGAESEGVLPCRFGGIIPAATCEAAQPAIAELNSRVGPLVEQYMAALEKIKLKEGIRLVMTISAAGNKFFQVPLKSHPALKGLRRCRHQSQSK